MLLGIRPSEILGFEGPGAWVFDLVMISKAMEQPEVGGKMSVAERIRRRREKEWRRRYIG